jgi:H+/Cl- antiporter ClcA
MLLFLASRSVDEEVESENKEFEEAVIAVDAILLTDDSEELETLVELVDDAAEERMFRSEIYILSQAALIGVLSGWSVGIFKLSIEAVRRFSYGAPILANAPLLMPLIPALGGLAVALLNVPGPFPPGLRGTVEIVDQQSVASPDDVVRTKPLAFLRKTTAAVCTLGTGCSLGPEGPSVEVGMSMSQLCIQQFPMISAETKKEYEESPARKKMRSRLLLACGAAAGVSAGFNAPIAGVFFALEIVQGAFRSATAVASDSTKSVGEETIATATSGNISAILISSVLAALTSKGILGDHLVFELKAYTLRTPFIELPLYLMLGALSGLVAFAFSQAATLSKNVFDGDAGPAPVRQLFGEMLPQQAKPVIGGLICGLVGLVFPQILFFGYETLNGLLANSSLPTGLLLSLLLVKMFTTAISAGSGLVGGTFAPSLFLGGMVGASFHNIVSSILLQLVPVGAANDSIHLFGSAATFGILQLADVPAYAMVGAASVLAALFRAPLTASLLLFELTRDYDVILPLMASAGVGSLVSDLVELKFERLRRRGEDSVSWGDLASGIVPPKSNNTSIDAP